MSRNNSNVAGEFVIKGTVDASGVDAGMESVSQTVGAKAAEAEAKVSGAMSGIGRSINAVTAPFRVLYTAISRVLIIVGVVAGAVKTLTWLFDSLSAKADANAERIRAQAQAYEELAAKIEKFNARDALSLDLFKNTGAGSENERRAKEIGAVFTQAGASVREQYAKMERDVQKLFEDEKIGQEQLNRAILQLRANLAEELAVLAETQARRRAELEERIAKETADYVRKQEYELADERTKIVMDYEERLRALTARYGESIGDDVIRNEQRIRDQRLRVYDDGLREEARRALEQHERLLKQKEEMERRYADAVEAIRRGIDAGFARFGGGSDLDGTMQTLAYAVERLARRDYAVAESD